MNLLREPLWAGRHPGEELAVDLRADRRETRMAGLAERIANAVTVAADPGAAMAEVTGAHREARGAIDAAETERDAERAAQVAEQRRVSAEDTAEQALAEVETIAERTEREQRRQAGPPAEDGAGQGADTPDRGVGSSLRSS